jgi:hypothetical protein
MVVVVEVSVALLLLLLLLLEIHQLVTEPLAVLAGSPQPVPPLPPLLVLRGGPPQPSM